MGPARTKIPQRQDYCKAQSDLRLTYVVRMTGTGELQTVWPTGGCGSIRPNASNGVSVLNCQTRDAGSASRRLAYFSRLGMAEMKLSIRCGIVGIAALAALSVVHWLRGVEFSHDEVSGYLLGVAPNFCAAVAVTFVVLSIWADQQKLIEYRTARRWFLTAAAIAGVGLLGWEVIQRTSDRLVFDSSDIGATLAGLVLSGAVFHFATPRMSEHISP